MKDLPTKQVRDEIIQNLLKSYDFLESGTIGKSACGRDIPFLSMGTKFPNVLWLGAFHGMEWLTSLLLLEFLNDVCKDILSKDNQYGVDLEKCIQKRGLTVIPCVNPDGVEISLLGSQAAGKYKSIVDWASGGDTSSWQSNARGVDLNHNYDAGWYSLHESEMKSGIIAPSSTRYGGASPHSEPETRCIVNFCEKNEFDYAVAFHSQGEEIYWKYGGYVPEGSYCIAKSLAFSSGYCLSSPKGLAVGGGFKDWFITKFQKPAFTIEVGKGKNPLPVSDLNLIYKKLKNTLFLNAFG